MATRVGINGCGRIGRLLIRMTAGRSDIEIVGVNNRSGAVSLAHLIKYDSVHGRYRGEVAASGSGIRIDGRPIPVFTVPDPRDLPWGRLGVDVVVEATGKFTDAAMAARHLEAGCRRVVVTAPVKGRDVPTVVMGVNDHILDGQPVVSSASCTTTCMAPMARVLHDAFEIELAVATTVHAFTADQRLVDASHDDLRRARCAATSMIPTQTGAAKAVGQVIPELAGRITGIAIRVPVPNGSLVDLVAEVRRPVTAEGVNAAFREAANGRLKGILEYTDDPIVSTDVVGNDHACVFDAMSTLVMGGRVVKALGWYDNEWGYARQCLNLVLKVAGRSPVMAVPMKAMRNGRHGREPVCAEGILKAG